MVKNSTALLAVGPNGGYFANARECEDADAQTRAPLRGLHRFLAKQGLVRDPAIQVGLLERLLPYVGCIERGAPIVLYNLGADGIMCGPIIANHDDCVAESSRKSIIENFTGFPYWYELSQICLLCSKFDPDGTGRLPRVSKSASTVLNVVDNVFCFQDNVLALGEIFCHLRDTSTMGKTFTAVFEVAAQVHRVYVRVLAITDSVFPHNPRTPS